MIELLVALVLGFLVVAGLINLFIANRKSYQVQSGNNFLQEDLRIASDRIGWSLRMADYWGGNKASDVAVSTQAVSAVTANGACNGSWVTAVSSATAGGGGVYGYDGGADFPATTGGTTGDPTCIGGAANYVPGSDVLVLRFADTQPLSPGPAGPSTPAESSTITGNANELFVVSIPQTSAQLINGGTTPSANTSTLQSYAYAYQTDMYYLRPCSVIPGSGSTCTAAADGGQPLPTLMRMHLNSAGALVSDAVVDGIEQLKFEYGVAPDLSNVVTPQYYTATQVTTNNQWANVVSVRVSLVAVNPVRDVTIPHVQTLTPSTVLNGCTYTIKNNAAPVVDNCPSFVPFGDKPWQYVRTAQQFVVQLRNRIRG